MRNKDCCPKSILVALLCLSSLSALAQNPVTSQANNEKPASREQVTSEPIAAPTNKPEEQSFQDIYRRFHTNYKLGPNDEIAVRIIGQPDYSLEKAKISPVGRIFHPLLGDIEVAGRTIPQLTEELTKDLSEYLLNPKVSVSLLETKSAKIGVLGEVVHPGILVMNEPMTVLDAIKAAGGITEYGDKSNVIVYRQADGGKISPHEINLKKLLAGKTAPGENLELQPGDTVEVHGNTKRKVAFIASLTSLGGFMTYIGKGR